MTAVTVKITHTKEFLEYYEANKDRFRAMFLAALEKGINEEIARMWKEMEQGEAKEEPSGFMGVARWKDVS